MPANFGILQAIKPPEVTGYIAPSGGGEEGDGGLMEGLSSLMGGIKGMVANKGTSSAPTSYVNEGGTYGSNAPSTFNANPTSFKSPQSSIMTELNNNNDLKALAQTPAFQTGLQAHQTAMKDGITKSPVMTVVDYSLPATQKRMWVVDTQKQQILMNTYVAQGKPGFSNIPNSKQSSIGTFLATTPYQSQSLGKEALKLQGLEPGVNDNAFRRGIVVHGGDYIGPDKQGTSWGCFTVPNEVAPKLIGMTKGGTIIHAYAPNVNSIKTFNQTLTPESRQTFRNTLIKPVAQAQGQNSPLSSSSDQMSLSQPTNQRPNINFYNPQYHSQAPAIENAHPELLNTMKGIYYVETGRDRGNPYQQLGPNTKNMGYAIGKYQIMSKNVPSWTKMALGKSLTPEEFRNNPQAQERTAAYMLNQSLNKGYSPEDTASIWFSGRPAKKAGNSKDAFGTTVPDYIKVFNKGRNFKIQ